VEVAPHHRDEMREGQTVKVSYLPLLAAHYQGTARLRSSAVSSGSPLDYFASGVREIVRDFGRKGGLFFLNSSPYVTLKYLIY
jgi:hypothetical protein